MVVPHLELDPPQPISYSCEWNVCKTVTEPVGIDMSILFPGFCNFMVLGYKKCMPVPSRKALPNYVNKIAQAYKALKAY
jgi:hypothetical protein